MRPGSVVHHVWQMGMQRESHVSELIVNRVFRRHDDLQTAVLMQGPLISRCVIAGPDFQSTINLWNQS